MKIKNEVKALTEMVDRSDICDKVSIVNDRGDESYNSFVYIQEEVWNKG